MQRGMWSGGVGRRGTSGQSLDQNGPGNDTLASEDSANEIPIAAEAVLPAGESRVAVAAADEND
jgi:hypothetical protein